MMKNRKHIVLALLMALGLGASAQNGLNVPYSQYGIGLTNLPYNMPSVAAMGGVTYTRAANNSINPFNPASYAAIEKESFVFDMGFRADMSSQKDNSASLYDADGNLGYIAVGFPITRWWKTAFAILPLSDVSYESVQTATTVGADVRTRYEGDGGVSRMMWGHAFNLGKNLSLGFNANYLYGGITRGITYSFTTTDSSTVYMDSRRQKTTLVSNFSFDMGLQYFQPLGHDYELGIGLTAALPRTMMVKDNALAYTFVTYSGNEYMRDTIFPNPGEDAEYSSTLEQPLQLGMGLSFKKNNHWLVAIDGTYAPWSGLKYSDKNDLLGQSSMQYDDNLRFNLGFQLLGDLGATHYVRRITYSAGAHYESGRLRFVLADGNPYKLDEWGFGLGATLPMRKGRSLLNISASYSSLGTGDLLRHNCFSIGLSVSSSDSWFVKRKYN